MLVLYVKTGCPYCGAVKDFIAQHNLEVSEKNVADEGVVDELVEKGGRRQVPFLIDEEQGSMLYESGLIIDYLTIHYVPDADSAKEEGALDTECSEC